MAQASHRVVKAFRPGSDEPDDERKADGHANADRQNREPHLYYPTTANTARPPRALSTGPRSADTPRSCAPALHPLARASGPADPVGARWPPQASHSLLDSRPYLKGMKAMSQARQSWRRGIAHQAHGGTNAQRSPPWVKGSIPPYGPAFATDDSPRQISIRRTRRSPERNERSSRIVWQ